MTSHHLNKHDVSFRPFKIALLCHRVASINVTFLYPNLTSLYCDVASFDVSFRQNIKFKENLQNSCKFHEVCLNGRLFLFLLVSQIELINIVFIFESLIFWFSKRLRFVKQSVVKFAGLVNTSSLLNPEPSFTGEDFTKHFYNFKVKT